MSCIINVRFYLRLRQEHNSCDRSNPMITKRASLALTILLSVLLVNQNFALDPVHGSPITVSDPRVPGGPSLPITRTQKAQVFVNVSSTYPIANVTLYYAVAKNDVIPQPLMELYNPVRMDFAWGGTPDATYVRVMDPVANDTWVWGFAKAFDIRGNSAGHVSQRSRIYRSWTPNPNASTLDVDVYVRHVDPKRLTLNISLRADLTNYVDYGPEILQVFGYFPLSVNQPAGVFSYTSGRQTKTLYYSSGHPELYPFDKYDFTFYMWLPKYLNQSGLRVGKDLLQAFTTYPDTLPIASDLTLEERQDNSAWDIHSYVQFIPSHNFTAGLPSLKVTITLERLQDKSTFSSCIQ